MSVHLILKLIKLNGFLYMYVGRSIFLVSIPTFKNQTYKFETQLILQLKI